jgi:hypothetical protein
MSRVPDEGRYMERMVLDTTPEVEMDEEGRLSYTTETVSELLYPDCPDCVADPGGCGVHAERGLRDD